MSLQKSFQYADLMHKTLLINEKTIVLLNIFVYTVILFLGFFAEVKWATFSLISCNSVNVTFDKVNVSLLGIKL